MRIVVTGCDGFLGWHTRVRLATHGEHVVVPVGRSNWSELPALCRTADAVMHCAGVNRADPDVVESGNIALAGQLAAAIRNADGPLRVVYANSVHSGRPDPYGRGKEQAGHIIRTAVDHRSGRFVDVLLPNLFGEHGRPHYNSFVATFAHAVVHDSRPDVADRRVEVLHAQTAAQCLIDGISADIDRLTPDGTAVTVDGMLRVLLSMWRTYRTGDIPALTTPFDVDVFNTLRSAAFPAHYPIGLPLHSDRRGRLVETVRTHGGRGQTFVSTTRPGVTRGEHFHLRKVERFVVLSGQALIEVRRMFHREIETFEVNGDRPMVVDMPTMWAHNITNVGSSELVTLFWTDGLFDPAAPDTYPAAVRSVHGPVAVGAAAGSRAEP